jgi:hypothetical protein
MAESTNSRTLCGAIVELLNGGSPPANVNGYYRPSTAFRYRLQMADIERIADIGRAQTGY